MLNSSIKKENTMYSNKFFDTEYARSIFFAMQVKPMYLGTVDPVTKQERREKNRKAHKQRNTNRRLTGRP
jgi:hypothetical protein